MLSLAEKRKQLEALLRAAEPSSPVVLPQSGAQVPSSHPSAPAAMAIIGLAGRYPGADNLDAFWTNLAGGRNCIEEIHGERAEDYAWSGSGGMSNGHIRHFGLLRDIYRFDAPFFNISRREAEVMDPHMRLLLETVWSCIENAGYRPRSLDSRTGVFAAFYNHEYSELLRDLEIDASSEPYLATATTGAIFANRISFLLGLNGPSEVYDTACSSALVALHRSIQAIAAGDCRQAIVAGVSLLLTPGRVAALGGLGILNRSGRCNPYSHPANGEVLGEGVGAMLIKPLEQALAERDHIYAVIRGTDVNHQGDRSGRMTLPSADALADLLAMTYRKLGIGPSQIRYVEGHGAGGEADVVELRALQRFLEQAGLNQGKVPVGSVKGNIGFGEASGGMAQLTKCALAFHHRQVPATLHFERVDPVFDLEHSGLEIQSKNVPLNDAGAQDCLSILAYGLGGTNAHVVMSGHTSTVGRFDSSRTEFALLLSAGSEETLAEYVRQLGAHLADASTRSRYQSICGSERALLLCMARTLAGRERHAKSRAAFLVDSLQAFQECCAGFLAGAQDPRIVRRGEPADGRNPNPVREGALRWVAGDNAAAEDCVEPGEYQKLPLPGVPFRGEEYRLQPRNEPLVAGRPPFEKRWRVSRSAAGTVVELSLTREDCFAADHLVDGVPTMPGTAYVALLSRIARQVFELDSCTIENLAWTSPLELDGRPATVRFEFGERGAFRIYHQEPGRLCCKGRLRLQNEPAPADCPSRIRAAQLEGLAPMVDGVRYWAMANSPETRQVHGAALRRLSAIHQVGNELIGVLEPLASELPLAETAFLDSALGTCRGFALRGAERPGAVVPFAVERVHLLRPVTTSKRAYAVVTERRDALNRYDISVEDGAGEVYAVLQGYYAKPISRLAGRSTASLPIPSVAPAPRERLLSEFRQRIAAFLKCEVKAVPLEESLAPLGLDSIGINALTDQISRDLNFDLPATLFFEYPNLRALVEYLAREFPEPMAAFAGGSTDAPAGNGASHPHVASEAADSAPKASRHGSDEAADIAVVGMGGLFPGARNVRELWEKLREGQDLITEMPEPRRRSVYRVYADSLRELKGIYGGFVEDADKFDAAFFGFSEQEVMAMDPQQRLFLEAAWAAIEDAGYYPLSFSGRRMGVYVGAIVNDYSAYLRDIGYPVSMFHEGTGSSLAGIANRLSYLLNLTGPSQAVDTACCSSLYAIDRAVSDLRSGACEAAIAGGVSFACTAAGYDMYRAMSYLAKDWRCKAFAEGGDGWSKAELFAAVFLKRYEDAIRDRDPIYAVIKATGTNHGGKGYFYTQPNSTRHVELIREVCRKAQVDARSIVHVEAHGSGTGMGDALEFNAIARALREFAEEQGVSLPPNGCGIGSIKSNLGHAEAGAGIAGFIKAVLLLHQGTLPPTLHLKTINQQIRWQQSPLYLVQKATPLAEVGGTIPAMARCAGVHSFNFSGAAAHALIAEHVAQAGGGSLGLSRFPLCLSAKTPHALAAYGRELARFLKESAASPDLLPRLVYTINRSRSYFPCRRGIIADSLADLIAQLEAGSPTQDSTAGVGRNGRASDYPALCDETVEALVERWRQEADFDWAIVLKPFSIECLHLPTYPFEHDRSYFPQAGESPTPAANQPEAISSLPKKTPGSLPKPASSGTVEAQLAAILGEVLSVPVESIDLSRGVGEFGFDSLKVVALSEALNQRFGLGITPPDLFGFSTPREIAAFISASKPVAPDHAAVCLRQEEPRGAAVAIVGMSGQFPGASDLEGFWRNLVAGKDGITEIPPDRWDWKAILGDPRRERHKTNVRWGGFIDDVPTFDPLFFRISPREAETMDPQQRLLMMYVWRAIEDAGYRPLSLAGTNTGLFVGTGSTQYGARIQDNGNPAEGYGSTGSIPSLGPNRMSHFLDLHGPSEPVETSCSSSLVAIHRAVLAIQMGECDVAIAGGINTIVSPEDHIAFSKAGMLCEDGRCKTFSAQANGYVRGEGVGMLVLKPLTAAEAAGDHIYGVIRASAINHGGRANSLTAPNPKAQAELLRSAYSKAGIDPRSVGYIEAHGTGTALGDPIEINALKLAFKALYEATGSPEVGEPHCGLASVKTNIGHLELAAGVAGVIKVLLQLRHGTLVRSLHCPQVNPYIQLAGSPFYLLLENRPWPRISGPDGQPLPRRAGISSFGFGGVNAHLVIEEYVPRPMAERAQVEAARPHLVVLSARNDSRLDDAVRNLRDFLERHPDTSLDALAYTLQVGREEMEARLAVVAGSIEDLKRKLRQAIETRGKFDGGARGRAEVNAAAERQAAPDQAPGMETDLARLADHWVNGGQVDWAKLHAGTVPRRISLPVYPFARERYWWKMIASEPVPVPGTEPGESLFVPRWEESGPWLAQRAERVPRSVVIVHSGPVSGLPEAFVAYCKEQCAETGVLRIEIGDQTQAVSPEHWRCGRGDAVGFETCLKACGAIDCLVFVPGSAPLDADRPTDEVVQLLRLPKALQRRLSATDEVDCFIVTTDAFRVADSGINPAGGGLTGLAYSLAQGDHRLRVRNIDISAEDAGVPDRCRSLVEGILAEPPSDRGEVVKFHLGSRYRQILLRFSWPEQVQEGFRQNGVYVILGGSGQVGDIVTRDLIRQYRARVVWLGRRPEQHPDIRAKFESYRDLPGCPVYIQADALDLSSLRQAADRIKAEYGTIHGALFAGAVFSFGNPVAETTEAEFTPILDIKTRGSLNFYEVFKDEPLDFMCFFSSAQAFSFSGAATLAAYAAGITFCDALVRSLQEKAAFPVGAVNWGFWESAQQGPAVLEHAGFLDAKSGTVALKRFVGLLRARALHQIVCLRTTRAVEDLMPIGGDRLMVAPETAASQPGGATAHAGAELPALTEPAGAEEFEEWMLKLLSVQTRELLPAGGDESAVAPELRQWARETRRLLDEKRALIEVKAGAAEVWAAWEQRKPVLQEDRQLDAQVALADRCLRQLPQVLGGKVKPAELLFPGASLEQVERVYADNSQFTYFSQVVAEAVRAYVDQQQAVEPGFRARILELGAGTGGTTAVVLDRLRGLESSIEEYCYSDLSRAFLTHGERNFSSGRPFLKFRLLDIEQPVAAEAPGLGSYDLVIAANVLHATRNIRRTIRHAKAALKRGGQLILDEIAGPSLFAHLTFGLLPGWWLFEDAPLRIPGSPGLYPDTWDRVLREEGFGPVSFPAREAHRFGQQVIVANSDGLIRLERRSENEPRKEVATELTVSRPAAPPAGKSPESVKQRVIGLLSEFLKIPGSQLAPDVPFSDYGVDSIVGISFVEQLGAAFGISLNSAILFNHSTIDRLSAFISETYREQLEAKTAIPEATATPVAPALIDSAPAKRTTPVSAESREIAVIGMAGQFPGAKDVETLWQNLIEGKDVLQELPAQYLRAANPPGASTAAAKLCSLRGGILEERACFDPLFFSISPREAESMNPHQRLILQESWKALEDAGINPRSLAGQAVGLFIGAEPCGYEHESFTGASDALIASRLSYFLDLKGPALVVNTGCSSSATAIHLACESLRNGESSMALAGGVFAVLSQELLARLSAMDLLSPTGCCHSLDAAADGTVFSEAVGVVVLKRLSDAIADGDPIYGVIQASGMNQDGASNGITAPNGAAQEALLVDVYRRYGIAPERISYVEAHGTGTRLGDPVEANALVRAFQRFTDKKHFCAVGSAKALVGHASAAAGVIGLIKLLLMMRHGKIPAMRRFATLNPLIEFANSAFYVNTADLDWPAQEGQLRMAALNSFGHSGTNVHLVVRGVAEPPGGVPILGRRLVVLSAKDEERLKEAAGRLASFAASRPTYDLGAVAYTLQVGRESMKERLALVAGDAAELGAKLRAWLDGAGALEGCWRGTADPQNRALQLLQSDDTAAEMLGRWIAADKLDRLAEFWAVGGAVDWRLLYQGVQPPRVRLPTYPFAREYYWAPLPGPRAEEANTLTPAVDDERVLCFEETWEPLADSGSPATPADPAGTLVCLLSEPHNQEALRQAVQALSPKTRVLFVSQADIGSDGGAQSLVKLTGEAGTIDALWYFWSIESRGLRADLTSPLRLVKALAEAQLKPKRLVLAGAFEDGLERARLESWVGIERSLGLILPGVRVSVLLAQAGEREPVSLAWLANCAWGLADSEKPASIVYLNGVAHALRARPVELKPAACPGLDGKTLLITGGGGGLGLLIARRLAAKWRVNLVLTGRSALPPGVQCLLSELAAQGHGVHYCQADVCDARAMEAALREARAKLGPIHGVVHAAGIKDTRTLFEKTLNEAQAVLAPKVEGTLVLDEVLAQDPLEFVCYFSSSAAVLGDFGACDYAMANRFQMAYAAHRNALVAQGKRSGQTRVIGWTMWSGTGMGQSMEQEAAFFLKSGGQRPLRPEEGLDLFERLLGQPTTQHIVLAGRAEAIGRILRCGTPSTEPVGCPTDSVPVPTPPLAPQTTGGGLAADLKEQLGHLFKLPLARIGLTQNFADFGIDSIGLAEFAQLLSKRYAIQFTPSVFFGHSTLETLAGYLAEQGVSVPGDCRQQPIVAAPDSKADLAPAQTSALQETTKKIPEPIAILGMSGRFAGARDIEEMWQILAEGRSAVGEIPAKRFDGHGLPAKLQCGCIPGVAEFEPLFFEISPAEAEEMDPRQRLLLQEGWNALEDAGFGPEHLKHQRIGMFVGVEEGDYPGRAAAASITANHTGILSARLAYFLNLRGPVLAINTSCSSSLAALHQACLSLQAGECDAALVGGVNLLLAPDSFAALAEAGMLSPDGTCYAFDRRANGMVPGEAVAAVVLKPLSRAVADGDPIHAVILGSGINYDGKTNGITAPSGVAQAELVRGVLQRAGVEPQQVEYVVTHGTGTRLGDPVEVNALLEAFGGTSAAPARCALTSCKTNFGHAFAASGLVSLIALVQAMRRQVIPASLHFQEPNEFIPWEKSPFYVNTIAAPWPARADRPRIGAVSAFGMSGTNAHVVLRDYAEPLPAQPIRSRYYLLAWSAKTREALVERIRHFVRLAESGALTEERLPDISRTLLLGRHPFVHRCAVVIRNLAEAVEALKSVGQATRQEVIEGVADGTVAGVAAVADHAADSPEALRLMAERWCRGGEVDFLMVLDRASSRRVHLPTYPFSRREYWLKPVSAGTKEPVSGTPATAQKPGTGLPLPRPDAESFTKLINSQDQDFDRLLAQLLAATLGSLGLWEEGRRLAQVAAKPSTPLHLERWLEESRRLLRESGLPMADFRSPSLTWAEWEAAKTRFDASLKPQAALAEQCLRALPEVLRGDRRPVDVLFPEGSVDLVEAVYRGNPVADLFNRVVAETVAACVERRLAQDPNARIRVLEIGAGTGGTTAAVLALLAPFKAHLEEYGYSDLSKAFLLHAEEQFVPGHPYVVPRLFDVSRPVAGQGVAANSYDLVIAANVLHATADIRQAVSHAAYLLRRAGVLVLNELSANGWFTHLTFGLLEGWWLYQDQALRLPGCPGVSSETWERLLLETGFHQVQFPAEAGHSLGQQVIVAELKEVFSKPAAGSEGSAARAGAPDLKKTEAATPDPELRKLGISYFKKLVGAALKLEEQDIDPEAPLETYGMDSLMIGRVLAKLREAFKVVPGTLLFEVQTVAALTDYFLSNHEAELGERLGWKPAPSEDSGRVAPDVIQASAVVGGKCLAQSPASPPAQREPIAIIGLSGHYPSAPDLHAFWENLKAGTDCIGEIPPDRWSLEGFFQPDMEEAIDTGKSYCKWGGFLDGFWNFDPLFFNLSPAGALETDPQERLFVQAAWEVLEDAGYTRKTLAEKYEGRVGVFAGIAHAEFNVLGPDQWRQGKWIYPRTSFGSVANRVSYLFNLNGPSIPIDTMCSSALTAIHEACESILRGECAAAIAGAVNLCLHPSIYVSLCASRLLSKGAQCHSFGVGEDGYVPGEGVGVVLLKRLSEAVRDGDRIHAVIRGTAVNHGGRTNGYTVPNPNAQAQVIRRALDNAGVDARMVSYVEAHGAGTKLGDPIEVLGLTRAFRQNTGDSGFCALGSVKSNVGHLEAAAGMAGLTKVILQMQHRQLVPSLHAESLNPEIRFEQTPFAVQRKLQAWERPVVAADGSSVTYPRIAGISAFGAGGSNAHVIVEEYEDKRPGCGSDNHPRLIVLSARNQERLKESAVALGQFIAENPNLCLADIAFTLQVGREAMEERLGFVAESPADLTRRLSAFIGGKAEGYVRGSSRAAKAAAERFLDEADLQGLVSKWVEAGDYTKLLEVWVRGYEIDWNRLYPSGQPRRIGLPTYPFAKERYWPCDLPQPSASDQKPILSEAPGAPGRSWLFFREQWEPQPLADEADLKVRLARFAGKRIAMVAADPAEAELLGAYLRQLEKESALARPLRISTLSLDAESKIVEAPEVVLFLGPRLRSYSSAEPSETDLAQMFHLSRRLMNGCWGDAVAIYYLYEASEAAPRADCEAMAGFLRAAQKENEQHVWTLVGDYGGDPSLRRPELLVREWLLGSAGNEVRYQAGTRQIRKLAEIAAQPQGRAPFRQNGVYLLAGGLGYLGRQLSLELARRYQATLVLLTRGGMDESRQAHCRELEALGAKVICRSVDITNRQQLETVYQAVSREVGPIHGVFHLARHHEDELIARKSWDSFLRVIRPKVQGALYLDELTKAEPLDFFVLFSSLGAYGVRGSSDYSYATAFENSFSALRNRWVEQGLRSGASTSICWGPWLEDHLFPASRAKLVEAGFALIDMKSGFPMLAAALAGGVSPLGIVSVRDRAEIRRLVGLNANPASPTETEVAESIPQRLADWENRHSRGEDVSGEMAERITADELARLPDAVVQRLYRVLFGTNGTGDETENAAGPAAKPAAEPDSSIDQVTAIVRNSLADVLQLSEIDDERSFLDYGLDSIAGMKLAVRLERRLKREVSPQWLISFPTVAALSQQLSP